jgi:very-short-patch-repair endonuclease
MSHKNPEGKASTKRISYAPVYASSELWALIKPLARQHRAMPTPTENKLWQELRNRKLGPRFRRQHPIDRFIADFYCPEKNLVIEVDGPIHQYTQEEDALRQAFIESHGLSVLRFTTDQVDNAFDTVLAEIRLAIEEHRSRFET